MWISEDLLAGCFQDQKYIIDALAFKVCSLMAALINGISAELQIGSGAPPAAPPTWKISQEWNRELGRAEESSPSLTTGSRKPSFIAKHLGTLSNFIFPTTWRDEDSSPMLQVKKLRLGG